MVISYVLFNCYHFKHYWLPSEVMSHSLSPTVIILEWIIVQWGHVLIVTSIFFSNADKFWDIYEIIYIRYSILFFLVYFTRCLCLSIIIYMSRFLYDVFTFFWVFLSLFFQISFSFYWISYLHLPCCWCYFVLFFSILYNIYIHTR